MTSRELVTLPRPHSFHSLNMDIPLAPFKLFRASQPAVYQSWIPDPSLSLEAVHTACYRWKSVYRARVFSGRQALSLKSHEALGTRGK